jgi:Flp pilus assembly pilin Flp
MDWHSHLEYSIIMKAGSTVFGARTVPSGRAPFSGQNTPLTWRAPAVYYQGIGEGANLVVQADLGQPMGKRAMELARGFFLGEQAQAAVEYALVVSIVAALLIGVSAMVVGGLSAHYREVTSVVCLPIP